MSKSGKTVSKIEIFKALWADKSTRESAKELATEWVKENRGKPASWVTHFDTIGLTEMVKAIDYWRDFPNVDCSEQIAMAEMYLLACYKPQKFVGTMG